MPKLLPEWTPETPTSFWEDLDYQRTAYERAFAVGAFSQRVSRKIEALAGAAFRDLDQGRLKVVKSSLSANRASVTVERPDGSVDTFAFDLFEADDLKAIVDVFGQLAGWDERTMK